MYRFLLGVLVALAANFALGCWLASQILGETDERTTAAPVFDPVIGLTTTNSPGGW